MRIHHLLWRAAALFCAAALLGTSVSIAWGEPALLRVSSETAEPGEICTVTVTGNDLQDLAGVSGIVSYDTKALEVASASVLYMTGDANTKTDGEIRFSGITLDGLSGSQDILSITLRVKDEAQPGRYPISLAVGNAYDTELKPVSIAAVSGAITVQQPQPAVKTVYFYGDSDREELNKDDEVTFSVYTYDANALAAGKLRFRYDPEIFTLVSATPGEALQKATCVVDVQHAGDATVAFASADALGNGEYLKIKLRPLADEDSTAQVNFSASALYDDQRVPLQGVGFSQTLSIRRTEEPVETPSLRVLVPGDLATNKSFTATVTVDGESALAAGDFCISYDPEALTCVSVETDADLKDRAGALIMTNENFRDGQVRFSFVDPTGITGDTTLLHITFHPKQEGNSMLVPSCVSTPVTADREAVALNMESAICSVKDAILDISLVSMPFKMTYVQHRDVLDVSGGKILLRYYSGNTQEVDLTEDMVSGFDNAVLGKQTLIVSVSGFTTTFEVEVIEKSPTFVKVEGDKLIQHYTDDSAVETALKNGTISDFGRTDSGEKTLTLFSQNACVVAYKDADGNYVRLKALANKDGSYRYSIPGGVAEVTVAVKGDLDSDGQLTAKEARQLLTASTNASTLTKLQYLCADLDGNGVISAREARILLKASTGNAAIDW